jgi:hypothetical protein
MINAPLITARGDSMLKMGLLIVEDVVSYFANNIRCSESNWTRMQGMILLAPGVVVVRGAS